VFVDALTGFQTSDLRDAQNQVIQFNSGNELIWTADGTRLPGYRVWSPPTGKDRRYYFIEGKICEPACEFEVRFGTENGEPRASLTIDYGHDNPGTMVDVEVVDRVLHVAQTGLYPPGTPTLSGIVTGRTTRGPVALEEVEVWRGISSGWRLARTDRNGFYEIRGLIDGGETIVIKKGGYETQTIKDFVIAGNTRFDIELTEEPGP